MSSKHYNPERKTWRGKSYKRAGVNIRQLKDAAVVTYEADADQEVDNIPDLTYYWNK